MRPVFFRLLVVTLLVCSQSPGRAGEAWSLDPEARLVLGQSAFDINAVAAGSAGMSSPFDIAIDSDSGKVFVVDAANHRILRFASFPALSNGGAAEAVFGQPEFETVTPGTTDSKLRFPYQATVDSVGRLWVTDRGNARVLRFDVAAAKASGAAADGVLGQADFVSVESQTSRSRMRFPFGIAIDGSGTLFVSEYLLGNRVLIFVGAAANANGADASAVLGQPDFTDDQPRTTRNGMSGPRGLALDSAGNLYVADTPANRVMRFDAAGLKATGAQADGLLGQTNFTDNGAGGGAGRFTNPWDLAIDAEDRLWVADLGNRRLLGFSGAAGLSILPSADLLLGQPDFLSTGSGTSERRFTPMFFGVGGAFDSGFGVGADDAGRVWVADTANHRVLAFNKDNFRPDFRIGKTASASRGNNRYNGSGAGQTQIVALRGSKKARLTGKVENDGNLTDAYTLRGRGTTSKFKISVFLLTGGRQNITGAVRLGTHTTIPVAPNGVLTFNHELKPRGVHKTRRRSIRAWLQASSINDGEVDRIVSYVKNIPRK